MNVGVRPTFDGATRLVEAHLLDVAPDLYGRRLTLAFLERIRPERRFASLEALRAQIAEDVARAGPRYRKKPPVGLTLGLAAAPRGVVRCTRLTFEWRSMVR